jgi:hypothetical protein
LSGEEAFDIQVAKSQLARQARFGCGENRAPISCKAFLTPLPLHTLTEVVRKTNADPKTSVDSSNERLHEVVVLVWLNMRGGS